MAAAKQFTVGNHPEDDFTQDEIDALVKTIADWFRSEKCDRNYKSPLQMASQKVQECLLAETAEGKPWKRAPKEFAKRIKAKTLYDMTTDEGTKAPALKNPNQHRRINHRAQDNKAPVGGAVQSDWDVEQFRKNYERSLYNQFPELDNAATRPDVRNLSLLVSQRETMDRELSHSTVTDKRRVDIIDALNSIQMQVQRNKKLLDIHPDQLRKRIDSSREGSLGDLVSTLGDDSEFLELERTWALQLAYQLWWMANHQKGNASGPQLEPFEVWHMTRSVPMNIKCKCGHEFEAIHGFEPEDLRNFLLKKGMDLADPVIPNMYPPEALQGIDEDGG